MNVIKLADTVMLVPPFVNVTAMKVESPPVTEDVTPEPVTLLVIPLLSIWSLVVSLVATHLEVATVVPLPSFQVTLKVKVVAEGE